MFIRKHTGVSNKNKFVWFEDWVIGRQTIEQISKESGYPTRTLIRYLHDCLAKQPVFSVYPSERVNLLIDGTYFNNDLCLILYRDNTIKFTQLYRLTNGEWYEELKEDLENLSKLGVQIESITCDGHKGLLKAVRKVCKQAAIQRCLVHIQRMCKIWLTMRPQSQAGMELRRIVSRLHLIRTTDERDYWLVSLVKWHQEHEAFINEKALVRTVVVTGTNTNWCAGRSWSSKKRCPTCFITSITHASQNQPTGWNRSLVILKGTLTSTAACPQSTGKSLSYGICTLKTGKLGNEFF